uniref:Major latex allergen Hev b 4 n=1 Tax=Hevea brasiliensis TaxID=3981 RepID=Q6T4P0_HEVBR|nr:major latex allergen Hev b 4 [Hevea brasiliensis]
MASLAYSLFILSLFTFTLLNPVCTELDEYLFSFGDGLYDAGNAKFIYPDKYLPSYHHPYGTTFFDYPTGRFSDGRTVVDFVAENVSLPRIPPFKNKEANFTYGANFASEGATASDSNPLIDFRSQIRDFGELKLEWAVQLVNVTELARRLKKAVYLISFGADDYLNYEIPSEASREQLESIVDVVLGNISDRIKELYDFGARKFVVENVAPLGLIPFIKQTSDNSTLFYELASLHAMKLPQILEKIQDGYLFPEFNYTVFNYFGIIKEIIDAPGEHGFKYGDIACCGNSTYRGQACGFLDYEFCVCGNKTEYLFFDGTHNTDAANNLLAELMWDKESGFISPYGVKDFFPSPTTIQTLLTEATALG